MLQKTLIGTVLAAVIQLGWAPMALAGDPICTRLQSQLSTLEEAILFAETIDEEKETKSIEIVYYTALLNFAGQSPAFETCWGEIFSGLDQDVLDLQGVRELLSEGFSRFGNYYRLRKI